MQSRVMIAASLLVVSLTACSGQSQPATTATITVTSTVTAPPSTVTAPPAVPTYIRPRNPVEILKMIPNCELEEGVVEGNTDINGNRYSNCTIGKTGNSGHEVSVRTYPGDPRLLDQQNAKYWSRDDTSATIIGDDFVLMVQAIYVGDLLEIDPAEIQKLVGGEVY